MLRKTTQNIEWDKRMKAAGQGEEADITMLFKNIAPVMEAPADNNSFEH